MSDIEPSLGAGTEAFRLDHVGIVVTDLDDSLRLHRDALGMSVAQDELLAGPGLRAIVLATGPTRIELLCPVRDETPVTRFLQRRGPGIHHIAYRVERIDEAVARLVAAGLEPLSLAPEVGIAGALTMFFHPRSAQGILIELVGDPRMTET